jgi:hypothetical protein
MAKKLARKKIIGIGPSRKSPIAGMTFANPYRLTNRPSTEVSQNNDFLATDVQEDIATSRKAAPGHRGNRDTIETGQPPRHGRRGDSVP